MNAWLLLILAGLCEIGWPLGLKWAQSGLWRLPGFIMAGVCMLVSGALLFMALFAGADWLIRKASRR